jgi:hypothetical protein
MFASSAALDPLGIETHADTRSGLTPLNGWGALFHGRFETSYDGRTWTVDVDFLDPGRKLNLYRDGTPVESQKSPATFELGAGGTIEASMTMLGMRQIDLVVDGETTTLAPVDGTPEAWRLRLGRERPGLSRAIGAISWIVLVIAFVTGLGELVALTGVDSPFAIANPFNTIIGLAALFAALERALRFKTSRWLG